MAGEPWACGQFALSTGTGTQDFTLGGETRTPVAALFQWSGATALATNTNHAFASFGACDGTREWFGSVFSETGVSASDSYTRRSTDAVIVHLNGSGTIDGQLSFNSFIAGGVRLDIDNSPGAAYIGQIFFFFTGSYRADTFTTGATIGTPTSVTTTGVSPPTFLILQEFGSHAFGTTQNTAEVSLGFAADNGTDLNAYAQWTDLDAKATTEGIAVTNNAYGSGFINAGVECSVDYVFTASGFDATPRLQNQAHNVGYLAGDIPGFVPWAGHLTFPTAAGAKDFTEPGTRSHAGLIVNTALTSETLATGGAVEGWGCGMFTFGAQFSLDVQTDDNRNAGVNQTLTRCYVNNVLIDLHAPPTTTLLAAAHTGSSASGFTVNVTTPPAATRLMPVLVWTQITQAVDETLELQEELALLTRQAIDETVTIIEETAFSIRIAVDELLTIIEVNLQGVRISFDETLDLIEGAELLTRQAIEEVLDLLEELNTLLVLAPPPGGGVAGEGGFPYSEAGEGGFPGAVIGSG